MSEQEKLPAIVAAVMPLARRAELEQLLIEFAKADARYNHALGERHKAMHAITEWAQGYANLSVDSANGPPTLAELAMSVKAAPESWGKAAWLCQHTENCTRPLGHPGECFS